MKNCSYFKIPSSKNASQICIPKAVMGINQVIHNLSFSLLQSYRAIKQGSHHFMKSLACVHLQKVKTVVSCGLS